MQHVQPWPKRLQIEPFNRYNPLRQNQSLYHCQQLDAHSKPPFWSVFGGGTSLLREFHASVRVSKGSQHFIAATSS